MCQHDLQPVRYTSPLSRRQLGMISSFSDPLKFKLVKLSNRTDILIVNVPQTVKLHPTWAIMVSLYCFFCVTLMGGCLVTAETRKFIRMSSQLAMRSTIVSRLAGM